MALEVVTEKNKLLYLLPENPSEQRDYKKFVRDNSNSHVRSFASFKEFISVKYINSNLNNEKIKEKVIDNLFYISNSAVFGFCKIDFENLESIFMNKTFNTLANNLEDIVRRINSNKYITPYLEGRTIKEIITERVKSATNEIIIS